MPEFSLKVAGDHLVLPVVVAVAHGLHRFQVDAVPYDVDVFPPSLHVHHHGARVILQA